KSVAIVFEAIVPFLILKVHWVRHPVADVQIVLLGLLSLIPNRWLVVSRVSLGISLVLAIYPLHIFLQSANFRDFDISLIVSMIVALCFMIPLPVCLVLSRIRYQRGAKFLFA